MSGIRMIFTLIMLSALGGLIGCSSGASAQSSITPGKGLFRSHEFRGTLKALPQWARVLDSAEAQTKAFAACDPAQGVCSPSALSWQKAIGNAAGLPPLRQLQEVNRFFNRWPYGLDIDIYGVSDYWATPGEFLRLSGDCEDYSIIKYFALRKLGFPIDSLRIVLLRDNIRNIAHAVLAVRLKEESYILDNLTDMVLSHHKYEHYVPQYSVNERYRWAHVTPGALD
ncbi:MAG: hypothetical protein C0614_14400 [Desulfuromonas sp.]|nr:MAG: hypothetical protein C0614_14400 [Desulfuromonas sp.]